MPAPDENFLDLGAFLLRDIERDVRVPFVVDQLAAPIISIRVDHHAADSGSRVMIYADGYYRSGKLIDHKRNADIALDVAQKEGTKVEKVLVWRRHHGQYLS